MFIADTVFYFSKDDTVFSQHCFALVLLFTMRIHFDIDVQLRVEYDLIKGAAPERHSVNVKDYCGSGSIYTCTHSISKISNDSDQSLKSV